MSRLFSSLASIKAYAKRLPELPEPDNNDPLNPHYPTLYRTLMPSMLSTFINLIRGTRPFTWKPHLFKQLIKQVTQQRQAANLTGLFIHKMASSTGKYCIFSDLHGCFHSFVRSLQQLVTLNILTDSLVLAPNYYIIINGNAIDRGPYSLEVLTTILRLMTVNPHAVFYLKGSHETDNTWHSYNLKTELLLRAPGLGLATLITHFFNTLPLALYLADADNNLMRISYDKAGILETHEQVYTPFLREPPMPGVLQTYKLVPENKQPTAQPSTPVLKALIYGAYDIPASLSDKGLAVLTPYKGATTWRVLSGPLLWYRKISGFFYDAFVILTAQGPLDLWTIGLYTHHVDSTESFETYVYQLVSENRLTSAQVPIHKKQLTLGCTLDLSKTSAALGLRLCEGLTMRINRENSTSSPEDYYLDIVFLDDYYTPYMAKKNIMSFLQTYKTDIVLSPLGTPTTQAYLDLVEQQKILVLFPCTGAMIFRQPSLDHIINFRTSYANEAQALVYYALNTLQVKKLAFFYQDDSYGQAALAGAQQALRQMGISQWLEAPYTRNNPNVLNAAHHITEFNPEALFFFATPAPAEALVRLLGVPNILGKFFLGISFLTDVFRDFLRTQGLELIISRVIPDPRHKQLPIVQEYQQALAQYRWHTHYNVDTLEGYINASLLIYILEQIQEPFTKERIINYVATIHNTMFKGLMLDFDPVTHELSKQVWLDTGKGTWITVQRPPSLHSR